jgi:hypothetical protein
MKIKLLISFCMTLLCLALPVLLLAQGDPGDDPDAGVPLDGGLSLLIAAGVGYAAKKGYDKRKKQKAAAGEDKSAL